ncbi:MAG TPA: hypothetical protein VE129_20870 [Thermoanaerobaculia bacterium]|nr:hypothetical protein [Thermoanaerobaculia bacterium]
MEEDRPKTSSYPVLGLFALTAFAEPTALAAQGLPFTGPADRHEKEGVSTRFSEIKATFNPDGSTLLFATDGRTLVFTRRSKDQEGADL